MSNFFQTSDGKAVQGKSEYKSEGARQIIPKGTRLLASIEKIGLKEYEGDWYINVQWKAIAPAEYKNATVFQKVRVWDGDDAKRGRAIHMLAAIDHNCGGQLMRAGEEPNDDNLRYMAGKQMVVEVDVWKINGKEGNWVSAVSASRATTESPAKPSRAPSKPPAPAAVPAQTPAGDDDIPF